MMNTLTRNLTSALTLVAAGLSLAAVLLFASMAHALDPYDSGSYGSSQYDSSRYGSGSSGYSDYQSQRQAEDANRRLQEMGREADAANRRQLEQQRAYNDAAFGHTFRRGDQSVTCYPGPTSNQSTCF